MSSHELRPRTLWQLWHQCRLHRRVVLSPLRCRVRMRRRTSFCRIGSQELILSGHFCVSLFAFAELFLKAGKFRLQVQNVPHDCFFLGRREPLSRFCHLDALAFFVLQMRELLVLRMPLWIGSVGQVRLGMFANQMIGALTITSTTKAECM